MSAPATDRRPTRQRATVDTTHPDVMLHGNAVRELVGVGEDTLRRWVTGGVFPKPTVRIQGRPRWRCKVVLDWLRAPRLQG